MNTLITITENVKIGNFMQYIMPISYDYWEISQIKNETIF